MATVFLQLFGKKEVRLPHKHREQQMLSTVKFPLEYSLTNKIKFKPGQVDLFEIDEADVGKLKKIRVSHNGKKVNSGWHLKRIMIRKSNSDRRWIFNCGKWLDAFKEERKLEMDLYPLKGQELSDYETDTDLDPLMATRNDQLKKKKKKIHEDEKDDGRRDRSRGSSYDSFDDWEEADDYESREMREKRKEMPKHLNRSSSSLTAKVEKTVYEMKIKTSEYSKTNSELTVNLIIFGETDPKQAASNEGSRSDDPDSALKQTKLIKLNNMPSDNDKEKFNSNSLDIFKMEEDDVGSIEKIKIYVNTFELEGVKQEWYFDEIVINVPSKRLRYL